MWIPFSQSQPDGLDIFHDNYNWLGIKFLIKPIEEGHDAESGLEHISKKITQSMLFGCGIGWFVDLLEVAEEF